MQARNCILSVGRPLLVHGGANGDSRSATFQSQYSVELSQTRGIHLTSFGGLQSEESQHGGCTKRRVFPVLV